MHFIIKMFIVSLFYSTNFNTNLLYINSGDNMKKRFKSKKRLNTKNKMFLILIIFIFSVLWICSNKIKFTTSNIKLINSMLGSVNYYSYLTLNDNSSNIIDNLKSYIDKNFNSPTTLLESQLNYKKEKTNEVVNEVKFSYSEKELPLVYIYNSHQGENYSYKYLEDYNIIPNVLMAANMLKDKLEDKNINTLVEESDILEYMKQNNLNHAGSYIASRNFLEKVVNKYPSIKLFIDLHRDAAPHSATYTNIDFKDYAKILFVIGLENPNYEKNLSIVNELNNKLLSKYPTITRGIMKKKGAGVNGVYNQDINSNVILIEVGGNENNIDEINNTLDIISEIIGEYINEKK